MTSGQELGIYNEAFREGAASRDAEIVELREQVKLLRDAEPVGAVLVDRESREGIMFYSTDMIPDLSTIKDKFELIKVYAAPADTEPKQ